MLVVTTETVPGYEVRSVIGEVVGVTVRAFNPYLEGVKSLNGRLNPQLARMLTLIRHEAVARMIQAAQRRGANAVVGMRFDQRSVSSAWNEVCAYGTAVLVGLAGPSQLAADTEDRTEPIKTEPVRTEPIRTEQIKTETDRTELDKTQPDQ